MLESLLRRARGQSPAYGDLAEQAARLLTMITAASFIDGGDDLLLLGAHLAELRTALERLASTEIAVQAIYDAGRRDERAGIFAARRRARHAAPTQHPHLRALPAVVPIAAAAGWAAARHGVRAARAHAVAAAVAGTAAVTVAGTVTAGTMTILPLTRQASVPYEPAAAAAPLRNPAHSALPSAAATTWSAAPAAGHSERPAASSPRPLPSASRSASLPAATASPSASASPSPSASSTSPADGTMSPGPSPSGTPSPSASGSPAGSP
jgi:hypothetical protein